MGASQTAYDRTQLDDDFFQDPHAIVRLLRGGGPVRPVTLPRGLAVWLVTGYADAKTLLADPSLSKDARKRPALFAAPLTVEGSEPTPFSEMLAAHMLNTDPPDHTRLRKLVNKAFTARTVASLRPRIEQIAADLLDDMAGSTEVDLLTAYAFPLPITVICELLGVPAADRESFRAWSTMVIAPTSADAAGQASQQMAGYLSELVARKREEPADDLLSGLVHVTDAGDQLSEPELISMAFLLLVAGHETTVNLIGNGLLALLRNPEQLAALRADPGLLPNAVEEFLRYDGPVNLATLRFTTEPVQVGDVEIPADEFVLISLHGANRDSERFDDPDRLDITRQTAGHLAFGHGIHYCVGAPLARLEGEIAISRLLERFPDLRLATEPEQLRWRQSTLVRALETLPLALRP
ncbi:cytochrome P450 [Saccharomonospora sp. NPDC046836]|uniref:cytochrome P450 family protein n=1 Tax=Saccharomonospora sp. NPDC046836 TaxID=3156921 RepID=UPI0034025808